MEVIKTKKGEINFRATIIKAIESGEKPEKLQKEINVFAVKEKPGAPDYGEYLLFRLWKEFKGKKIGLKSSWSMTVKDGKLYHVYLPTKKAALHKTQPKSHIQRILKLQKKKSQMKTKKQNVNSKKVVNPKNKVKTISKNTKVKTKSFKKVSIKSPANKPNVKKIF